MRTNPNILSLEDVIPSVLNDDIGQQVRDEMIEQAIPNVNESLNSNSRLPQKSPSSKPKKKKEKLRSRAGHHSIIIGTNNGNVTQNNYNDISEEDLE